MNPLAGILLIMFGGVTSGSFYLPLKFLKKWSWETGWVIQGIIGYLVMPWLLAFITIPKLCVIVAEGPAISFWLPILFGLGWGVGGLTWGLSIRYLGIGLGNALPLGLTAALSTLIPPIFQGRFASLFATQGGIITFTGVIVSLVGIALCGWAGSSKDKEINGESNKSDKDFNLKKGLLVALVAGVMSACFAFGEAAGKPLAEIAAKYYPGSIWVYNPVYAIVLIGGLIFNMSYCFYLGVKNKTTSDYTNKEMPLKRNYSFAVIAGILWFGQFVFKGMGTTKMGQFEFVSWSILFSFTIIFSNLWGLITKEWKGVSKKTYAILFSGLAILIVSAVMIGIGSR